MKTTLVIILFTIVFLLILCKILYIYIKHIQWKKLRKSENIPDILKELGYKDELIISLWLELANSIRLDAHKLRAADRLCDLTKLYSFPEILYDDIEDFLQPYHLENASINTKTSLGEIIMLVYKKQTCIDD